MHFALFLASLLAPAFAQRKGPDLDEMVGATDTAEIMLDEAPLSSRPLPRCDATTLPNGVQLPFMPELFTRYNPNSTWGTQTMVDVIVSATQEVRWLLPDADPVLIGDISHRRGGFFDGHKSHRSGIDADIGLYWGKGFQSQRGFMPKAGDGLDLEANWLLIRALLSTGEVDRILLDQGHINSLRRYTIESGELTVDEANAIFPARDAARKWEMRGVVQHTEGHRDHLHIRLRCGSDHKSARDTAEP